MQKMKIALCDDNTSYSRLFMEMAGQFSGDLVQTRLFSTPGSLKEYISERGLPDLILLKESLIGKWAACLSGNEFPEEYICVLTESEGQDVFQIQNQEKSLGSKKVQGLYIYQDIITMLKQMEKLVTGRDSKKAETAGRSLFEWTGNITGTSEKSAKTSEVCELIGFYSPIRRTGQSTYAWNMAEKAGNTLPVLFINLEPYAGIRAEGEDSLADLLYYIRQEELSLSRILEKVVHIEGNIHRILPMPLPIDLWKITETEWLELFHGLKEKSYFQKIYIDFGDGGIQGLFEILDMCSVVYTSLEEDPTALAKLSQYEQTLRIIGKESILQKTRRIYLRPHGKGNGMGRENMKRTIV